MFAKVIPAIRTPRHVAYFDYEIPEGLTLAAGDVVEIPFRNKKIIGVVTSLSDQPDEPARTLKPVSGRYGDLRLSRQTLSLLEALATRSFSSPASVLHAWFGSLPKRSGTTPEHTHQTSLLPTREYRLLTDHWHAPTGVIATALEAQKSGKRVLILTPWADQAIALASHLKAAVLTGSMPAGARFKAWAGFMRGEHPILVTTRVGAWLCAEAEMIILDEPENDDHKQDEMAPRYDTRWIAEQAHTSGSSLMEIGLTPRVKQTHTTLAPTIDLSFHAVDIHRADWSAVAGLQSRTLTAIEEAREQGRSVIIIHPVHGDRARLRCADCGWTAACARCGAGPALEGGRLICHRCKWQGDSFAACPSCSGVNLSKSRPGRETTIRDLAARNFSDVQTLSLGAWNALPEIPQQALVVVSDLSLLVGGGEDTRRRERLFIAFRRLADACLRVQATLTVQSDAELLASARSWLTREGCMQALEREWNEREAFKLPPASRLIKLIIRGNMYAASSFARQLATRTTEGSTISGPYPVSGLPGTRDPRSIIQLILPMNTADTTIHTLLDPLLTPDILVDLDPIAFFE